jgi:hypothetical protein
MMKSRGIRVKSDFGIDHHQQYLRNNFQGCDGNYIDAAFELLIGLPDCCRS